MSFGRNVRFGHSNGHSVHDTSFLVQKLTGLVMKSYHSYLLVYLRNYTVISTNLEFFLNSFQHEFAWILLTNKLSLLAKVYSGTPVTSWCERPVMLLTALSIITCERQEALNWHRLIFMLQWLSFSPWIRWISVKVTLHLGIKFSSIASSPMSLCQINIRQKLHLVYLDDISSLLELRSKQFTTSFYRVLTNQWTWLYEAFLMEVSWPK